MTTRTFLATEWKRICHAAGLDEQVAEMVLEDTLARYDESQRHYHTTQHLTDCLRVANQLADEAENITAVRLALWFHDIVYDPQTTDNEAQSAAYAVRQLTTLGAADDMIEETQRLILATQHHEANANDPNARVVLDADLAILGQSPQEYDAYAAAIRREYDWVPEDIYREKRADVLRAFLARPRIYRTNLLYNQFETQARDNIRREIALLSGD